MKKYFFLIYFCWLMASYAVAEMSHKLIINGTTIEKEVEKISFEDFDVVLSLSDETIIKHDMNDVTIMFENKPTDIYSISNEYANDMRSASLYDMSGKLIWNYGTAQNLDYMSIRPGIYILKGGQRNRKLLKQYNAFITTLDDSEKASNSLVSLTRSDTSDDFSVLQNNKQNQMVIRYSEGGGKYYNTLDVECVEIDSEKVVVKSSNAISETFSNLESISFVKGLNRTTLYVRKDGTGDYTDIQSAINSITDADIDNQYEIRVCDDYTYTDLTELYSVYSPASKNKSALSPSSPIAAVITKDYVNVIGYDGKHKIAVYSPYDLSGKSFQYVQCMWLQGNCTIENIDFEIKNGRYAIHQESGGNVNSLDYNAVTTLKNVTATHLGNEDSADGGSSWKSICGQANGLCSGLHCVFENVEWYPAFYVHANKNFDCQPKLTFKDCNIKYKNGDEGLMTSNIETLGCGHNIGVEIDGCSFKMMRLVFSVCSDNVLSDACHDIRTFIPHWTGGGNGKMVPATYMLQGNVLAFETTNNNVNINVVGGTSLRDIWGETYVSYNGTTNAPGFVAGTEYIGSNAFVLGKRLGDCSLKSKTLIIEVNGANQIVTFNEDFSSLTNEQVVSFINNQLSGAAAKLSSKDNTLTMIPFKDCCEEGYNCTTNAIFAGAPVIRDYDHPLGWKVCPAGTKPVGIACSRINPGEEGTIALLDKNLFASIRDYGVIGRYAKVYSNNGYWGAAENEADADLIRIGSGIWSSK